MQFHVFALLGAAALLAAAAEVVLGTAFAESVAERNMPAFCCGEASSEFGVNPRHIESGEVHRGKHGFTVTGS
jgi:hypothetical protein